MFGRAKNGKIREYKHLREIGRELTSQIFRVIPVDVLRRAANDMGILQKGVFVFDSEEDGIFFQDRVTFDVPWDGKTALEHFDDENGSGLSESERESLDAMKAAYFSLFEVLGNASSESLQLLDVLSGSQIELMDLSLSVTAPKGSLFAGRVVEIRNICMTSGVIYPFHLEQKDILISGLKKQQSPQQSRRRRPVRRINFNDPRNYSLYFYKQYRRISTIEVRMADGLLE